MSIPICTMPIDDRFHLNSIKNDVVKVETNMTTVGEGAYQKIVFLQL